MTTLKLTDPDGDEWVLYQVQLDDDTIQASADVFIPPGSDAGDTFIAVLSEQESFSLTGLVTANRLSGTTTPNTYSSDWRTALAQYAQRGEAFATGAQFEGYTLAENDRGRSVNVVIEDFSWTIESGAIYQLSYELTLRRGEGLLPDASISVGSATPGGVNSVPTLGGTSLHGFERIECEKSMGELSIAEMAFGSAGDNMIAATQGMGRTFTYQGRYPAGKTPDQNAFDDTIRGYIDDTSRSFATVFPGYSVDVKVLNFDAPRQWRDGGQSHEYTITMQEATN